MPRMIVLLLAMLPLAYGKLSCLNNNLDAVAWYAAMKVPHKFLASYTDPTVDNESLGVYPGHLINTTKSSIGGTIDQVFQNKDVAFVAWNDECPSNSLVKQKKSTSNHSFRSAHYRRRRLLEESAHSKGIIAWDGSSGFWLVHSVPKFPDYNDQSYS